MVRWFASSVMISLIVWSSIGSGHESSDLIWIQGKRAIIVLPAVRSSVPNLLTELTGWFRRVTVARRVRWSTSTTTTSTSTAANGVVVAGSSIMGGTTRRVVLRRRVLLSIVGSGDREINGSSVVLKMQRSFDAVYGLIMH